MSRKHLTENERFFFDNAGYGYDPQTETQDQGHTRCAVVLAAAEAAGNIAGYRFQWNIDSDCDSSDWSDEKPAYDQYELIGYNEAGDVIGALGCIDFGRDGSPTRDNYARVCEAEMALQALPL
jgi:hypothetical protein